VEVKSSRHVRVYFKKIKGARNAETNQAVVTVASFFDFVQLLPRLRRGFMTPPARCLWRGYVFGGEPR
jgi:hypothetical protein